MAWIKVPILCVSDTLQNQEIDEIRQTFERLDLPIKEMPEETEERQARINTKHIVTYYPSSTTGRTILECVNSSYSLIISSEELDELIKNAKRGKKAKDTGANSR